MSSGALLWDLDRQGVSPHAAPSINRAGTEAVPFIEAVFPLANQGYGALEGDRQGRRSYQNERTQVRPHIVLPIVPLFDLRDLAVTSALAQG